MPKIALHWQIIIALFLGAMAGLALNQLWTAQSWASLGVDNPKAYLTWAKADPASTAPPPNAEAGAAAGVVRFGIQLMQFIGDLFLRLLRFIAVPIVLFSLIHAVAALGDPRKLGRIGGKTIALFLFTGFTSAALGVTIATLMEPGKHIPAEQRSHLPGMSAETDPTKFSASDVKSATDAKKNATGTSTWQTVLDSIPTNPFEAIAKADMRQVVAASILIGLGLTLIPAAKSKPVMDFCEGMSEAVLKLVQILMYAAPYAVFALICGIVAKFGVDVFQALAWYCLTVVAGLAIVLFIFYPLLTTLLTPSSNRVGWIRFFKAMAPAQILAFTSSSSAATLPVTMQCARDRLGADEDVAGFVCSLGVSFNMDGTALYQAIVVTFLAQLYGIDMTFADRLTVTLLAAMLSIGVPGIPGGSLVVMAVVLDSIGVPPDGILVILAVDRVLDMCRTVVNVSGDAMGTAIIAASEGKLAKPDQIPAA